MPVLMFLYPLSITLIVLALIGNLFEHDQIVYCCVTIFTAVAAIFDLLKSLPETIRISLHLNGVISAAAKILPWFDLNLGWLIPAIIGFAIAMLIRWFNKKR